MRVILALAFCLFGWPAAAGLTANEIGSVGFAPRPGAVLPLGLVFRDAEDRATTLGEALNGKPALLLPVDYQCRMTCRPALSILAAVLARTGLRPGTDFRLVLVGLDPQDGAAAVREFADARLDAAVGAATVALSGDARAIGSLMAAIDYRYVYDAENRAYAHPTGLVSVTAGGRIVRGLSSLALDETDVKLALVEAGEGRVGGVLGRLRLLCYGFDPVHGIYTAAVDRMLKVGGVLTALLLAGAIGALVWRHRAGEGAA